MKSPEHVNMAQLTAFVTSLSQRVSSSASHLSLAVALVLFGLYLYLVPNQVIVSHGPTIT
jgi:hypothetical protein